MNAYIERINNLLSYLPAKDYTIAKSYLTQSDFHSLKELVDSALYKAKKTDSLNESTIENLSILKLELDSYITLYKTDDSDFNEIEDSLY